MYDCIIIGNGPSGVSAAIYLKRFGLNVLIIGKDYGTLSINTLIENYYGIESINGIDLIERGVNQAKKLGIDTLQEEVVRIEISDGFIVETNKEKYATKTVFIGTGMKRSTINIPGLKEYEGKGVSYCAVCDGFLYRKKRLAIIGSGDFMKAELEVLKRFSNDIIVFTNGEDIKINENVVSDKILRIKGDISVKSIETTEGTYDVDAVFVAVGMASGSSFARHLGLLMDEKEHLIVDNYMTNIPGIFAGGDVIGGVKQIIKAASDGCNAAYKIKDYLKGR